MKSKQHYGHSILLVPHFKKSIMEPHQRLVEAYGDKTSFYTKVTI